MNILCNNYELICNISKYLIELAILISNHYYTFDNKFNQDQINNYLYYIINDINNLNLFWRCNGHTVYFDEVYIQKNWKKTIKKKIILYENAIKIKELQFRMKLVECIFSRLFTINQ